LARIVSVALLLGILLGAAAFVAVQPLQTSLTSASLSVTTTAATGELAKTVAQTVTQTVTQAAAANQTLTPAAAELRTDDKAKAGTGAAEALTTETEGPLAPPVTVGLEPVSVLAISLVVASAAYLVARKAERL